MLYEKLMENISKAVYSSLNEMAKNISYRTIDRKLWLSVSVLCSREKANEAEFVKPYGPDKNDKDRMVQRYVAALLIMKKPCPTSLEEIDKFKTFKLIGTRAIDLGATFEDIKNCYDENKYIKQTEKNQQITTTKCIKEPTLQEQVSKLFEQVKLALQNNNVDKFFESLTNIFNILITAKNGENTFKAKYSLAVGCEMTWAPIIKINGDRRYEWHIKDGYCSWNNKTKVLNDNENILSRLDRQYCWRERSLISSYDYNELYTAAEFEINSLDELICKIVVKTGPNCKQELLDKLENKIITAAEKISKVLESRKNFDSTKYDFDKIPSDYISWLVKQVPEILRNNGYSGKDSWYSGISIMNANCEYWTGRLKTLTPGGIIAWVGGDSTDDENKISYDEWSRHNNYSWRSSTAEATIRIDYAEKQEFSKNIYEYLKSLVQDGKLK